MSRLPNALEPLFPAVKRAHVTATRGVGATTRRTSARGPSAIGVPWRGTDHVEDTARWEPDEVSLHITASGHPHHRTAPDGHPRRHEFFDPLTAYDAPHRYLLEIAGGRVVGDYAAVLTPGGTLDYETSEYFGVSTWREHPIYLRTRLREPDHVTGNLLCLATRGTRANYYHFMMDLLPRWGIFQESRSQRSGPDPDVVLLQASARYQRELLHLIGIDHLPAIEPSKHSNFSADLLIAPSQPNPGTLAPPWTTQWLQSRLPPSTAHGLPRRIYLTRGTRRNTRRVVNETAILPVLKAHGFVVIDPGSLSVQEQIDHFAAAEVVVAPHGAALTNLNFCSPGVRVLEIFAPRYLNSCYWTITGNISGSRYRYLVGLPRKTGSTDWGTLGVQDDITVDPPAFAAQLDRLLEE